MLSSIFARSARKFLEKADKQLASRLLEAVSELQQEPFPREVARVENQWFEGEKVFRIRVGGYRILYCVNYEKNRLLIVNIDKRSHAYD